VLEINTSNIAKYAIQKDYQLRITISLSESVSLSRQIQYYFAVKIKHACADNVLSLASDLSLEIYYIDYPNVDGLSSTGNKIITPNVAQTVAAATCPLIATLEVWNSLSKSWQDASAKPWVQSFVGATGVLTVWTDSLVYHPITAYPNNSPWTNLDLRVTLRDPYSQTT